MTPFCFGQDQVFARPIDEIFAFFSDARNLAVITPDWLRFQVLSSVPITMADGTRIDYRLRLHGVPIRWQSEITAWDPPWRFVDEQSRGPFRSWIHEHVFENLDGRTLVRDRVRYRVLGGKAVNRFFVAPDVRRIFAYRARVLPEILSTKSRS